MDGDSYLKKKKCLRGLRNVNVIIGNLLFPPNIEALQGFDIIVCTEVIEHFYGWQRKQLMRMITHSLRPKYIVITTPNFEYNPLITTMTTKYRHTDHKIEYIRSEWEKEVLEPLKRAGYSNQEHDLIANNNERKDNKDNNKDEDKGDDKDKDNNNKDKDNKDKDKGDKDKDDNKDEDNDNKGKDNNDNKGKGDDKDNKDNKGKDNKGKDNKGKDEDNKDNKGKDKHNKGDDNLQPSFIVTSVLCDDNKISKEVRVSKENELRNLYQDVYLPGSQIIVPKKKLKSGFSHHSFISHGGDVFYLSPTISPVAYFNEHDDYLEHPESAFNFYEKKGVDRVVCEKKYMGSRMQIFFSHPKKTPKHLKNIQFISKTGRNFFKDDDPIIKSFEKELLKGLQLVEYDWIILDGELMPWSVKGSGLIKKEFVDPIETALSHREFCFGKDSKQYKNASLFLASLSNYTSATPIHFRIFQILAAGKYYNNNKKMDCKFSGEFVCAEKRYKLIEKFVSNSNYLLKSVEYIFVDLKSKQEREYATKQWIKYCKDEGGEGYIVKLSGPLVQYDQCGQLLLPMLKVRGRDYLRIIYGIDYLEPHYLKRLQKRSIGKKRSMSFKQHEAARYILKAFISNDHQLLLRLAATFYCFDHYSIDATL